MGAFEERQNSEQKIPDEGGFTLADGEFDEVLPVFLDDALSKSRWVCFRIDDNEVETAKYRVLGLAQTPLPKRFLDWQLGLGNGKPLSLATVSRISAATLKTAMEDFSAEQELAFETATTKLAEVAEPQTLCVHRFQAPVKTGDEAARQEPELFDLPVTWSGTSPDARITVAPKVLAMKQWLLSNHV